MNSTNDGHADGVEPDLAMLLMLYRMGYSELPEVDDPWLRGVLSTDDAAPRHGPVADGHAPEVQDGKREFPE